MTTQLPSTRPIVVAADFEDVTPVVVVVPGSFEQHYSVHSEQVRRCRLAGVWAAVSDDEEF